MNRSLELSAREIGKGLRDGRVLEFTVFDGLAGGLPPTRDPQFAEAAIAIEKHNWLPNGICDATDRNHRQSKADSTRRLNLARMLRFGARNVTELLFLTGDRD